MASHPCPNPNDAHHTVPHSMPALSSSSPAGDAAADTSPDDALVKELTKLRDRVHSHVKGLGRSEEAGDGILQSIDTLILLLCPRRASTQTAHLVRMRQIKGRLESDWRHIAEEGTSDFGLALHADGTVTARINGKKVHLSRTLGQLLIVLASDFPGHDDALVAWKSYAQISRALSRKLGREMKPGAMRMNISRLRERLADARINPFLLQTRPVARARFARRRRDIPPAV